MCGLLLVIMVEPTAPSWTGGDELSGDWKPTILAVALMIVFGVIMAVPALRATFALEPMPPMIGLLVVGAVIAWLLLIRWVWRHNVIERFFGLGHA
jgi:cation-transporting ATPase E